MIIKYSINTTQSAFGFLELIPTQSAVLPASTSFILCKKYTEDRGETYLQFIENVVKAELKNITLLNCWTDDPTFLQNVVFKKKDSPVCEIDTDPGNYLFEFLDYSSLMGGHGNYMHNFKNLFIDPGDKITVKNGHHYTFVFEVKE